MFVKNAVRHSRNGGFTLVELLVVVGIIAVLIAILMPALKKAREQSLIVACQSNLRQIGLSMQMYVNENNGWMPSAGPNRDFRLKAPTSGVPSLSWPERLVRANVVNMKISATNDEARWISGSNYPVTGRGIFRCPAATEDGWERRIEARGYGMHNLVAHSFSGNKYAAFVKHHRLLRDKVYLFDGYMVVTVGPQNVAASLPSINWNKTVASNFSEFGIGLRHRKGANYMFPDWRIEWSDHYHRTGHQTPTVATRNNVWTDGNKYAPSGLSDTRIFTAVREWTSGD